MVWAPTVPILAKVVPLVERSILKPLSLVDLSVHERLIRLDEAVVAFRLLGAAGVAVPAGVGVGVEAGVGVAVGVAVGVGVGVGVEPATKEIWFEGALSTDA